MRYNLFAFAGFLLLATGCGSINPTKIKYNEDKTHFVYSHYHQDVTLRNQQRQLIDSTNIEDFNTEIELSRNKYPFENRLENELFLRNSDFQIAHIYSAISTKILEKNYLQAQNKLAQIRQIYPDIDFYSDCFFLEGYIYEKLGQSDLAADAYQKFNTFSSQKYSSKFRGLKHSNTNNSMYITERNYARHFIQQKPDSLSENLFWPIQPKFYYNCFQPGFIQNQDDFKNKSTVLTNLSLGISSDGNFAYGLMFTACHETSPVNVTIGGIKSNNATELFFGLPIQIIKTETNNFGLKISPYLFYSMVHFNSYNENIMNFGTKVSASYFLTQKVFLGSYYQINQFNEKNPYYLSTSGDRVWYPNEFDFSVYYNLFKSVNLKVGIKNKDYVAGFYLGNTEISYNFTSSNVILRTDIF